MVTTMPDISDKSAEAGAGEGSAKRARWGRAVVVGAALAGMISLSGVVLGSIYADSLIVRLVAGAAVGSVGLGVAARRLPNWTVAPASAVLLSAAQEKAARQTA